MTKNTKKLFKSSANPSLRYFTTRVDFKIVWKQIRNKQLASNISPNRSYMWTQMICETWEGCKADSKIPPPPESVQVFIQKRTHAHSCTDTNRLYWRKQIQIQVLDNIKVRNKTAHACTGRHRDIKPLSPIMLFLFNLYVFACVRHTRTHTHTEMGKPDIKYSSKLNDQIFIG